MTHQLNARINVIASGYKFKGAKPLVYEEARSQGVDVLSEFMVFVIGGSIIIVEVCRRYTSQLLYITCIVTN